jgi:hypothetical protein
LDYSQLSDPQLLAEAGRVLDELELELEPLSLARRAELGQAYDAIGEEYHRRCAPYRAGQ